MDAAKQKKETELHLPDEGIAHLEEVPELCELSVYAYTCIHDIVHVHCRYIYTCIQVHMYTGTHVHNL